MGRSNTVLPARERKPREVKTAQGSLAIKSHHRTRTLDIKTRVQATAPSLQCKDGTQTYHQAILLSWKEKPEASSWSVKGYNLLCPAMAPKRKGSRNSNK